MSTFARPAGARILTSVLLVATILSLSPARSTCFAAETPLPAAPARWVTDEAGFLSAQVRADLDARLRAFEGASGHQVLLWIGRSTGVAPIEDWASRAFASWRVGRKGLDDGVVLFIMADDRKIRIEVGYGLEERLPDVRASAIIRETIVPRLRDGDRDGAAREGIGAILTTLGGAQSGDGSAPVEGEGVRPKLGWGELALLAVLAILLAGFLLTHPNLAILLLTTLASGRGRDRGGGGFGGFGGGGGGFSGGGGRSGGGGATGSW